MENSLVSIIVPCYNQGIYLEEALESVYSQTFVNWECIIVNDGSLDITDEIATKWIEKDNRYKYFYKNNGGLSSARNYGIEKAQGLNILTLDADDKYERTFVEKGLKVLNIDNKIGVVSSWGARFIGDKKIGEFKPGGAELKDFLFCNAAIGTSLFRKECWEIVGGYDENMKTGYEDWEFYLRVCQRGWGVHIIEEVLFFYRQHKISMLKVALENHDSEIKKYIFLKHKELYKENYEAFVDNVLEVSKKQKKENEKIKNKIDFRIGSILLKPFRMIKYVFKKFMSFK